MTQTQLERLWPHVPARTLRYRTRRLHQLRLLGRTRPYRERGSAPHHLWPTAQADALIRGEPAPRRGGRREPNPLFLAHAATIAELYVALTTLPPTGTRLDRFDREHDAREPFTDLAGRARAVAPDATVTLLDEDGRRLVGLVELDLGTMSRTRLRTKARGYADWERARAWREHHHYLPAVLFLTTSRYRADAFRHLLAAELKDRARYDDPLVAATCANVTDLARASNGPVWRQLGVEEPADLLTVLEAAREPYDRARAEAASEREKFAQLLADPVALRDHLRRRASGTPDANERAFGVRGGRALGLLLASEEELSTAERAALAELATEVDGRHGPEYATLAQTATARAALERLADAYAERQAELIASLRAQHGDGPHLRGADRRLATDGLLDDLTVRFLPDSAKRDRDQHARQTELRLAYLDHRQEEARQLAREGGIAARVRGAEPYLTTVDQRRLRVCPRCEEVIYPDPERQKLTLVVSSCPYCGSNGLEAWTPEWEASSLTAPGDGRPDRSGGAV